MRNKCRSLVQCIPDHEPDSETVLKYLSCNYTSLLPFLSRNAPWCGWDYCHSLFSKESIGLPWQPEGFYSSLFGGPSILHALCHFVKPVLGECTIRAEVSGQGNTSENKDPLKEKDYFNDSLAAGDNNSIPDGKELPTGSGNVKFADFLNCF